MNDALRFTAINAVQLFVSGGFVVFSFCLAHRELSRGHKFDGAFFLFLGMGLLIVASLFMASQTPITG